MQDIKKNKIEIEKRIYKELLKEVEKPGRYTGKEYNEIIRDNDEKLLKIALAFPDLYEIGMSYLGFRILYDVINKREDALAERIFLPSEDMEELLNKASIPLFSLEKKRPLNNFNIIGISLQHELSYTNVLHILKLGKIPFHSSERGTEDPLIIAGGPSAFNPEPLANIIDIFILGDGEVVINELIEKYKDWNSQVEKKNKKELFKSMVNLRGVYVPSLYKVNYLPDGRIESYKKMESIAPLKIKKRIEKNLNILPFPTSPIVPSIDIVHNRITLEIFRGCTRGCRFCQAGIIYRPVRERSVKKLMELAEKSIKNTGYEEISLSSLSSSDYSYIEKLMKKLIDKYQEKGVGVSLPSLRIDGFSIQLARLSQRVRKTGLTFAPEVGSERLNKVVNKNVSEKDLLNTVHSAFTEGWKRVKLYFMIGLPTECWDDIEGIINLIKKVERIGKKIAGKKFSLSVSINAFIPKSHTPFQWSIQEKGDELEEKFKYIANNIRSKHISYSFPDIKMSIIEALLARGDRRTGKVLEDAYKMGCKFDSWREYFKFDRWEEAIKKNNADISFYLYRERGKDEILPWDIIDCGVKKEFLWSEWQKALKGIVTEDCRSSDCCGCGLQEECKKVKDVQG